MGKSKNNRGAKGGAAGKVVETENLDDTVPPAWWQTLAGTVDDASTAQVMISDWQAYVVAGLQAGRDPAEALMNADIAMASHMERQLALTEGLPPTPEEQAAAAQLGADATPSDVQ